MTALKGEGVGGREDGRAGGLRHPKDEDVERVEPRAIAVKVKSAALARSLDFCIRK